jgi:hypothetical protein
MLPVFVRIGVEVLNEVRAERSVGVDRPKQ